MVYWSKRLEIVAPFLFIQSRIDSETNQLPQNGLESNIEIPKYSQRYPVLLFIPFNPTNKNVSNLHFICLTFQKCNSDSLHSWMETVIESPTEGSMQVQKNN